MHCMFLININELRNINLIEKNKNNIKLCRCRHLKSKVGNTACFRVHNYTYVHPSAMCSNCKKNYK